MALMIGCEYEEQFEIDRSAKSDGADLSEYSEYCDAESECTQAPQPTKNRCVFFLGFDGSGVYSPDTNTAVGTFYKMVPGPAAQGANGKRAGSVNADTTRAYIEGVPSLPFGSSAERVTRGLSAVCQHLEKRPEPCDIILMGYSRGSVIANHVAKALNEEGCTPSGKHRGTEIAFFGSFDPVINEMGFEWKNFSGVSQGWTTTVPGNVKRFQQVYKKQLSDPRWGLGAILKSSPHDDDNVESSCSSALDSGDHPDGEDWHHGEIGHYSLPQNIVQCSLAQHGIAVETPICSDCEDENGDGWGWDSDNERSCRISKHCN